MTGDIEDFESDQGENGTPLLFVISTVMFIWRPKIFRREPKHGR